MKTCKRCQNKFGYVEFVKHRCYTTKEWKKLSSNPVQAKTNEFQFFNFFTKRKEAYDFITSAEVILNRYDVFLIDHTNKKKIGKMAKVPLKEKLKSGLKNLPGKITQKNFDKGMKSFDKGMAEFSKEMDALSKGLGGNSKNKPKLWSTKSKSVPIQGKKKKSSMKIWGEKPKRKNSIKIWNEKPVQKKKRKKSKSEKWDQHEKNLERIWGKRK